MYLSPPGDFRLGREVIVCGISAEEKFRETEASVFLIIGVNKFSVGMGICQSPRVGEWRNAGGDCIGIIIVAEGIGYFLGICERDVRQWVTQGIDRALHRGWA